MVAFENENFLLRFARSASILITYYQTTSAVCLQVSTFGAGRAVVSMLNRRFTVKRALIIMLVALVATTTVFAQGLEETSASFPDPERTITIIVPQGAGGGTDTFARTLAANSPVILADEPTGNLDSDTEDEIIEILKKNAHQQGKCVIVVTHSKELAKKSDVILELKDKKLTY